MARITPSSGATLDLEQLEDHEPYVGTLKAIGWDTSSPEYGSEKRLVLDWAFGELADQSVRDWLGLRLGKSRTSGTVSKLRMLLNALSERLAETTVEWFDPETLEWGYDKDPKVAADNKLTVGMQVIFRGKAGTKQDGGGKFTITVYQPLKKSGGAGQATATSSPGPKPKAAKAQVEENGEVPF